MTATVESVEALRQEMAALRAQFESIAPKFATYDMMLHTHTPWESQVEQMLTDQNKSQADVTASLQDLYSKADHAIKEINVKL